jgi:hypothetical protein
VCGNDFTANGYLQALLPVTAAIRARHPCLRALPVVTDLTKNAAMASSDTVSL